MNRPCGHSLDCPCCIYCELPADASAEQRQEAEARRSAFVRPTARYWNYSDAMREMDRMFYRQVIQAEWPPLVVPVEEPPLEKSGDPFVAAGLKKEVADLMASVTPDVTPTVFKDKEEDHEPQAERAREENRRA